MSYESKLPLLLERDLLIFSPWDALKSDKIADQGAVKFRKNAGHGITFSIHGRPGISDLTGKPTVEDMEVWWGDVEVTNSIPESLMQEWVEEALEEVA